MSAVFWAEPETVRTTAANTNTICFILVFKIVYLTFVSGMFPVPGLSDFYC
jgi:hypothetical protein